MMDVIGFAITIAVPAAVEAANHPTRPAAITRIGDARFKARRGHHPMIGQGRPSTPPGDGLRADDVQHQRDPADARR
ncbi:hypothetical protein [Longimicrobium terrae]|uniref:Uncharacterized protein n=1 Tax=Longimicrobium terrae TaxID=1639882 RepID=A0A841H5F1_9BACT|nr:hypothetical protein [Longimicrobium terrae]MBB4638923.1 hypothetical protein [Longimicrobium terrae]MBB6073162.1 hypothetical protein [Longimicrobium terrae]NNC30152.1 hypothetical protein [Longimicrobium terrae]